MSDRLSDDKNQEPKKPVGKKRASLIPVVGVPTPTPASSSRRSTDMSGHEKALARILETLRATGKYLQPHEDPNDDAFVDPCRHLKFPTGQPILLDGEIVEASPSNNEGSPNRGSQVQEVSVAKEGGRVPEVETVYSDRASNGGDKPPAASQANWKDDKAEICEICNEDSTRKVIQCYTEKEGIKFCEKFYHIHCVMGSEHCCDAPEGDWICRSCSVHLPGLRKKIGNEGVELEDAISTWGRDSESTTESNDPSGAEAAEAEPSGEDEVVAMEIQFKSKSNTQSNVNGTKVQSTSTAKANKTSGKAKTVGSQVESKTKTTQAQPSVEKAKAKSASADNEEEDDLTTLAETEEHNTRKMKTQPRAAKATAKYYGDDDSVMPQDEDGSYVSDCSSSLSGESDFDNVQEEEEPRRKQPPRTVRKQPARKQPARKQPARKQPARKQPQATKKQPQATKKQSQAKKKKPTRTRKQVVKNKAAKEKLDWEEVFTPKEAEDETRPAKKSPPKKPEPEYDDFLEAEGEDEARYEYETKKRTKKRTKKTSKKRNLEDWDDCSNDSRPKKKGGLRGAGQPPKTAKQQMCVSTRLKMKAVGERMVTLQKQTLPVSRSDDFDPSDADHQKRAFQEKHWPDVIHGCFCFTNQVPNAPGTGGVEYCETTLHMWAGSHWAAKRLARQFARAKENGRLPFKVKVYDTYEAYLYGTLSCEKARNQPVPPRPTSTTVFIEQL